MREFGLKLCVLLFLAAVFSGRTNEVGTLTGAITGTILFWPIYRRLLPAPVSRLRRRVVVEEDPAEAAGD
jgi:hypothetical protein